MYYRIPGTRLFLWQWSHKTVHLEVRGDTDSRPAVPSRKLSTNLSSTGTMESSLFVVDQCSWISWNTLTPEFTSPVLQNNDSSCVVLQQTSCPRNNIPTNQQNFDNPQTLVPANKNMTLKYIMFARLALKSLWVNFLLSVGIIKSISESKTNETERLEQV